MSLLNLNASKRRAFSWILINSRQIRQNHQQPQIWYKKVIRLPVSPEANHYHHQSILEPKFCSTKKFWSSSSLYQTNQKYSILLINITHRNHPTKIMSYLTNVIQQGKKPAATSHYLAQTGSTGGVYANGDGSNGTNVTDKNENAYGSNNRWSAERDFGDIISGPPAPLVIAGPSGSGKSTLLKRLMNEFPDYFGFSISHTTRKPRQGEQNGREYYFVSPDEFDASIKNDEFIEYTRFSNNYYGTSKKAVTDVQNSGKICILDVEIDGVRNLKKTDLNPRFVFVKPPDIPTLERRLRGRGTETEEAVQARLKRALEELKFGDIDGMFDLVIVNDDLDRAYEILREFVVHDVEALKKSRGM